VRSLLSAERRRLGSSISRFLAEHKGSQEQVEAAAAEVENLWAFGKIDRLLLDRT
jgi:hypothetical protein